MSNGPNRILDEFAKLMTDAAGAAQGVRREVETAFRGQAEKMLASMEIPNREEFEAAKEMAARARAENASLLKRLDALEARVAQLEGGDAGAATAATGRKKAAPKK